MKIVIVWKALTVGAYIKKIDELAGLDDNEIAVIMRSKWGKHGENIESERYKILLTT